MWKSGALLAILAATALAATDKFVCYHGSWANYRPGTCRYTIENIDPTLCTHIIYGFVGITNCKVRIMDSWLDVDLAALTRFTGLRTKNPNLKSLVAIGGWNEGSSGFSSMVNNPSCRATFIDDVIKFLKTYGFDGFDLDWEYPSQRGGAATDKANFSILLAELRAAFAPYNYLLTAAVAACPPSLDTSYEVPQLNKYLDFINVMTYDLHGAWETATGHNAPLYPSSKYTKAEDRALNVAQCIDTWVQRGADPGKLILGVGTYGRTFTLANPSSNGILAPAYNGGTAGPCTREASILGYSEICEKLKGGGWTVVWDEEQLVPYAYNGNQWIGYDDERSVKIKVEYAKSKGYGGIMVWSLETDDFNGVCGEVNILLKTIRRTLELPIIELPPPPTTTTTVKPNNPDPGNSGGSEEPSVPSSPSTTPPPVVPPVSTGNVCTVPGYIRDPHNCGVFYQCVQSGNVLYEYPFICPAGLYFDPSITACNWPDLVSC